MEKKLKFTRTNTAAVKGIAVMFLVFYHSFSDKNRLYGFPVSFAPLSQATEMYVGRLMVN